MGFETDDNGAVPTDDALGTATRDVLQQRAGRGDDVLTWDSVLADAHRVRRNRVVVGAALVLVFVGGVAGVAAAAFDERRGIQVAEPVVTTTTESASSTSTSTSSTTTAPRSTTTLPGGGSECLECVPPPPGGFSTTSTTVAGVAAPGETPYDKTVTADATTVTVDSRTAVRATLRNTGTRPMATNGYGSFTLACWHEGGESLGTFAPATVVEPGDSIMWSLAFEPSSAWVGTAHCGVDIALHGNAAGGTADDLRIEVVAPSPTSAS